MLTCVLQWENYRILSYTFGNSLMELNLLIMETEFDLNKALLPGGIRNELDLERAFIADRLLRVMAKEKIKLEPIRKKLGEVIRAYEDKNWSRNSNITQKQIEESDQAELRAEKERPLIRQYLVENLKHFMSIGKPNLY